MEVVAISCVAAGLSAATRSNNRLSMFRLWGPDLSHAARGMPAIFSSATRRRNSSCLESGDPPDAVTLSPNITLETKTFVWAGGVHIADIFQEKIKTGHMGRIRLDTCLRAENYPFIYAIGDNALAMNPETGQPVPAAAQFALQQGGLVADNNYTFITGKSCKPYAPRVIGEVISLGGHLAVGWLALPLLKKITFVGFLGSLIKAAIQRKHILLLRKESRNWSMR